MIHALGRLSELLNKALDGPNQSFYRAIYVAAFFVAGAYALFWFVQTMERAALEHAAEMQAVRAQAAAAAEAGAKGERKASVSQAVAASGGENACERGNIDMGIRRREQSDCRSHDGTPDPS
mmetsp:Transcript_5819/g.9945  ORF Transcript_5819/g.9945 Transcript_5819/m.9945 type:complete len:122 (+) Transcript_5819:129-494(+)